MSEEQYFEFVIGTGGTEQTKVRVYRAKSTGQPIQRLTPSDIANRPPQARFTNLLNQLHPWHLTTVPNPTATLVEETDYDRRTRLRIDTQPATTVYRNIQLQRANLTYAAVTIEFEGELCMFVDFYDIKLLRYLKQGLINSFNCSQNFNIHVEIRKRPNPDRPYEEVKQVTRDMIKNTCKVVERLLNHKVKEIVAKRMVSAKNVSKIARGTEIIEHISLAIEKQFAKLTGKEAEHMVVKKIPIVSTIMGVIFGAWRLKDGDVAGALAEVASGVAADIPGIGTAVSAGIDIGLIGKDIAALMEQEKKQRRLQQHEIDDLKEQNIRLRREVAQILPESPIFGCGNSKYFDEFELANVDDIAKIHVRCGDMIDGIQIEYRHSGKASHHGGPGGALRTFTLRPHEKIRTVRGTVVVYRGVKRLIASLTFETDFGRSETFGNPTEREPFSFEMTDGAYLGAIKGYDLFEGNSERFLEWAGDYRLLPAIGFIPKY